MAMAADPEAHAARKRAAEQEEGAKLAKQYAYRILNHPMYGPHA
jgi:protein-S-isoprenylcysteine O-methyltransferase Ste14